MHGKYVPVTFVSIETDYSSFDSISILNCISNTVVVDIIRVSNALNYNNNCNTVLMSIRFLSKLL